MEIAGAVVDDGEALHGACALGVGTEETAEASPASVCCRRRGAGGCQNRLARQPAVEEAPLAIGCRHAGHGADHAPTAPLQPPATQRVGLEADQQIEAKARK